MVDFKQILQDRQLVPEKRLSHKPDREVLLARCQENGQRLVLRIYSQPVFAYRDLMGHTCRHLPLIYKAEWEDGFFVVEEEWIDGISLQEMLDGGARMDEECTCRIGREVCEALSWLHLSGYVHRDIKPEHILMTPEGRTALIDMDASMRILPAKSSDTQLIGTAMYAAPEQFGVTRCDQRTDIYAMGILMNELLTGVHPAVERYQKEPLAQILDCCTRISPKDRYQSVEELADALMKCQIPSEADSVPVSTTDSVPCSTTDFSPVSTTDSAPCSEPDSVRPSRSSRKIFAVAAACMLTLMIFMGVMILAGDTETPGDSGTPADDILQGENGMQEETGDVLDWETVLAQIQEDGYEPLFHGRQGEPYVSNSRIGSQTVELYTEDGTRIDETCEVSMDATVGQIGGWDEKRGAWRIVSTGCKIGDTGYLYAEVNGKTHAFLVQVKGEPMSAYTGLPDEEDMAAGYLEAQLDSYDRDCCRVDVSYNRDEARTIYLVAMSGFTNLQPVCDSPLVTIKPYEGDVNWQWEVYELTFTNPDGGDVEIEVDSSYTALCFTFGEA